MGKPTADEVITQKHKRIYVQHGGAQPGNAVRYGGVDGQYMSISGLTKDYGETEAIRVPDPHHIGRFRNVARAANPGDLPSATVAFLEKHGAVPLAFRDTTCPINFYEATGRCKDLSDFVGGWESYVLVYSGGEATGVDGGDRTAWDGDDLIENSQDYTFDDIYPVGPIFFGATASNEVSREVADIVYGSGAQCGSCGPSNDGTRRIYAIAKSSGSGSPGLPGELLYSTDGGSTWTETAITGLGASEDPIAIDIVGDKLVILTATAGGATTSGYYWATLNPNTGAPGTFTKVTSGFVAGAPANDLLVLSSREIFFVAQSGYIYKATDITSGVSVSSAAGATNDHLKRIHGSEETLVAVGANSTVLVSQNRGRTWAAAVGTVPTTTATLQAVAVLDAYRAWVGSSSGRLFSTVDGGETWSEKVLPSGAAVTDIVFATDEVGYVAFNASGPTGYLYTTWNGGADWALNGNGPRLQNLPVVDRVNRIAFPRDVDGFTAANYLALAALHGDGLDGLIAIGATTTR